MIVWRYITFVLATLVIVACNPMSQKSSIDGGYLEADVKIAEAPSTSGTQTTTTPTTSTTAPVVITPNLVPTFTSLSALSGAVEDEDFTISYATLLAASNASDPEGTAVTFVVENVTTGTLTKAGFAAVPGSTTLSSGETLVWRAAADANGTLNAFTLKASDGVNHSATAIQVAVTTAARFDPNELPNLQLWLKADVLTLNDGDPVTSWTDSSGNNRHATEATIPPALIANVANSKPVVRWDVGERLVVPATLLSAIATANHVYTIHIVYDNVTTGAYVTLFDTPLRHMSLWLARNPPGAGSISYTGLGGASGAATLAVPNDGLQILSLQAATTGAGNTTLEINGGVGTSLANKTATHSEAWSLGYNPSGGGSNFAGDIAEVIVYNASLSAANKQRVDGYLAHKYGLTANLPGAHTYKTTPP